MLRQTSKKKFNHSCRCTYRRWPRGGGVAQENQIICIPVMADDVSNSLGWMMESLMGLFHVLLKEEFSLQNEAVCEYAVANGSSVC